MLLVDYYILDFSHSLCPATLGSRGVTIFSVLQTGRLSIGRINCLSLPSCADVAFEPRVVHAQHPSFHFYADLSLYINMHWFYCILHWFYYCMYMCLYMCGVQGTAYEAQFSLSTMWIQGLKLRLWGLAAQVTLTHSPVTVALNMYCNKLCFLRKSLKPKNLNQFCKTVTVLGMLIEDLLEGPAGWHGCDQSECRTSALPYFVTECRVFFFSSKVVF